MALNVEQMDGVKWAAPRLPGGQPVSNPAVRRQPAAAGHREIGPSNGPAGSAKDDRGVRGMRRGMHGMRRGVRGERRGLKMDILARPLRSQRFVSFG